MAGELWSVRVERAGPAVVVAAFGEVDMATVELLRAPVVEALTGGGDARALVLDLSGVVFLSASGVALLAEAAELAPEAGREFLLAACPRPVLRVLGVTGLAACLTVRASVAEALDSLN